MLFQYLLVAIFFILDRSIPWYLSVTEKNHEIFKKKKIQTLKEVTYEMLHTRFQLSLQILQLHIAETSANNTKHSIHYFLIYSCISTLSPFIWLVFLAAPTHLCN